MLCSLKPITPSRPLFRGTFEEDNFQQMVVVSDIGSVFSRLLAPLLHSRTSRAIFGHEISDHNPPLLTWAALMLLHIAGHGQERDTPRSFHMTDLGKEIFQILLKFVFYDILLFGIIFLFQFGKEMMPSLCLPLTILACVRTFSKIKYLMDQSKEVEGLIRSKAEPSKPTIAHLDEMETRVAHELFQAFQKIFWLRGIPIEEREAWGYYIREFTPSDAVKIIEVELNLIYNKFYSGVLPSMFELAVACLLPVFEAHSRTSFAASMCSVVHLYLIALFSRMFKLSFSVPLFLSWYAHMYQKFTTSKHPHTQNGLNKLDVLADDFMIEATALICTHQLVVHLCLMKRQSPVYDHDNDGQRQRGTERGPISGFNLLAYELPRKVWDLMDHYLWRPLLDRGSHWGPKRHRRCGTIPQFDLLVYALRKPRKVSVLCHWLLNTWPISFREGYMDDGIGEFVLHKLGREYSIANDEYRPMPELSLVDIKAPLEEKVLVWQLATGILYHTYTVGASTSTSTGSSANSNPNRDKSMLLSNYMGYLLIVQPWIMSKKRGDAFRRSLDALSEITELIHSSGTRGDNQSATAEMQLREICLQMQSLVQSSGETKSVVQSACDLTRQIKSVVQDIDRMWEVIATKWAKMLAAAAWDDDPTSHIRALSQGGELASIVWLWMVHLGHVEIFYDSLTLFQTVKYAGIAVPSSNIRKP